MSIILAIDDQIDNLVTIQAILKTLMPGTEVLTATSGFDGIKIAKDKQPSIILLDIIMPLMDGYDTCKVLKDTAATEHIPIVMITANSTDSNSKVKALELGADAFIPKPIEPVELVAQLKVVLRIQNAEAKLREERNNLEKIVEERTRELARNEERYKAIHNNAPLPLHSLDTDGNIVEINPAWMQVLGYNRDEVIGKWYGDFLHEDYVQIFKDNFSNLKKCGHVQNIPFKLRTKNGNYIEIRLDGSSGYDAEGKFIQTYCTFKDVTEEQKQQKRIEESEKKYRSFVEQFQGIAFLSYEDYSLDFFEGNVKGITGYTEKDFLEKRIFLKDLAHPEDKERLAKSFSNFLAAKRKETSYEYRILNRHGEVRWIYKTVTKTIKNDRPALYCTLQDISKLKLTEDRLKKSQKMAKVGSYDWDIINKKVVWSEGLYDIFGLPNTKQPNMREFANLVHPDDKDVLSAENVGATVQQPSYELQYRIIDQTTGNVKHVQVWGKKEFNEKEEVIRVQGTFQDITATKEIENELKNAIKKAKEADKLKTAFLANMSHEIRTPMNGIMGFLDIIKDTKLNHNEQKQYINIVQESGKRLLNTINDIIEISKIEAGENVYNPDKKDLISVCTYFQSFFEPEAKSKQIKIEFENGLKKEHYNITTDFNKLESILSNLLKNAIKFTSEGKVSFGVKNKEDKLLFFVSDTGMGIPLHRLSAIFDRFVQANLSITRGYEGSGLGLSICKAYCEMLNGEIWVESQENKGSTFYFTIKPEAVATYTEIPIVKEIKMTEDKGERTIIIAEDDDISFQLIQTYLREHKLTILRAVNGLGVLKILSEKNDISLILMDIKMPKLDGIETTLQIRKLYGDNIPIIAQTAFAMPGDSSKAIESGCNDYISKPLTRNQFLSTINKFL